MLESFYIIRTFIYYAFIVRNGLSMASEGALSAARTEQKVYQHDPEGGCKRSPAHQGGPMGSSACPSLSPSYKEAFKAVKDCRFESMQV